MKRRKFFEKIMFLLIVLSMGFIYFTDETNNDYPFPYDDKYFEAAERIVFTAAQEASLNIIPKTGKTLDIKLYCFKDEAVLCNSGATPWSSTFYGVKDSIEIPIRIPTGVSELHYQIEYKESEESKWRSIPKRIVRTPTSLEDKIEIILIGDDHTPDDADMGDQYLQDPVLRELRLNGEYVNLFLKELMKNPFYTPKGELHLLRQGFCLASTIHQIMRNENPDLIINLGDTRGSFAHKWPGLGLKNYNLTPAEIDEYEKIFRLGTRKIFSAFTPQIPMYWALGNHDGELAFDCTRESGLKYRKKYWKQPTNSSPEENYFWLSWGNREMRLMPTSSAVSSRRKVLIIVLDVMRYNLNLPSKPEQWTLGIEQKEWLKNILKYDADWKFVCFHHVLGGWPAGPGEDDLRPIAYGRGPLFTEEDYKDFCKNPKMVEQVELTRLMKENGVDAILYAHDHIFHSKDIGTNSKGRKMRGICVGSPKYFGERWWYTGELWRKYYGNFGRYNEYDENWKSDQKADFWGPSGYTKLTISENGAEIEYIRSAYHHLTNIPPTIHNGDCIQKIILR